MAGRGFSVILETLMILAQLSYTGSRFPTSSSSLSLGWQLMSWRVWNSFDKQDVKGHYNAGNCNSSMQPGSNHSSFVEYTPHSLLLRQQPGFETRYFLEVGTGANKEQTKHQDPIQGVHLMGLRKEKLQGASQTGVRGSPRSRGAGLGGGGGNGHVSLAPPATFGPSPLPPPSARAPSSHRSSWR